MNFKKIIADLRRFELTHQIMPTVFDKEDKLILNQGLSNREKLDKIILINELKNHLNNVFILENIDIDSYLIDSIRAYFQQTYDLKGLLLIILLAEKLNLFSDHFTTSISKFLQSQYRGNDLYGYKNYLIEFKKINDNYILYCSIYFNVINKILKEKSCRNQ